MAHFAQIDKNNKVVQVIVAEQDFIDSGVLEGTWIQTSYNLVGGEYLLGDSFSEKNANKISGNTEDKHARNRKNFAAVGYTYDPIEDCFIPPQPYPSWILNKKTALWEPPKPMPKNNDNIYIWDEELLDWIIQK